MATCHVLFDQSRLVVVTGKSFAGFSGLESIEELPLDVEGGVLVAAVRAAWAGRTRTMEYTDQLIWESYAPVRELFDVERDAMVKEVRVISHEDHFRLIPTEWKADNRSMVKKDIVILPPHASDSELAAGIHLAIELTTS